MPHDPTLAAMGTIHTTELSRDAVHIAVVPMVAAMSLQPGWHIGKRADGKAVLAGEDDIEAIGIVDPYLREAVPTGGRFFIFLYPGSITSLKHLWTHPAFDEHEIPPVVEAPHMTERVMVGQDRGRAYDVLVDVARRAGTDFEDLMRAASHSYSEYLILGTDNDLYDVPPEFWPAWSTYTGRPIPDDAAQTFSCSC